MNKRLINLIPMITMFPAILIGVVAMYGNNISTYIYAQNIVCFIFLGLLYFFVQKIKFKIPKSNPLLGIVISVLALILTFINTGVEGVHRWISVGPLQLYVSVIVMPIILINLWNLLQKNKIFFACVSIICVSILLTLQPDASIMMAFCFSSIVLLWKKVDRFIYFIMICFLIGLTGITWIFLDGLEPVLYVEGIFTLIANMGIISLVLGILSIVLMILPFFMISTKKNKGLSIYFGLYFIAIFASNLFGNFPVALLGYGISPIIGYFISIVWSTK